MRSRSATPAPISPSLFRVGPRSSQLAGKKPAPWDRRRPRRPSSQSWIRRYILFHGKRHPQEMGEAEINAFLTHLAVDGQVSASTQALCALLFLYWTVLENEVGELEGLVRAKRRRELPV